MKHGFIWSVVANHVHSFSCVHFLLAACNFTKNNFLSDWLLEHDNEFIIHKLPPQLPGLNPKQPLCQIRHKSLVPPHLKLQTHHVIWV